MHEEYRPGFFKTKLVRNGPFVPVRVWHGVTPDPWFPENPQDRSPRWQATIGEVPLPARIGGRECTLGSLWSFLHPIDKTEHDYLIRTGKWATTHAPEMPEANPTDRIDLGSMKPLF